MSLLSVFNSTPSLQKLSQDPFKKAIVALIDEMRTQSSGGRDYTTAGGLLKECQTLAAGDPDKIARVREKVESFCDRLDENVEGGFESCIASRFDQNEEFIHQLIDLKIYYPYLTAKILVQAVKEQNAKIVAHVLNTGFQGQMQSSLEDALLAAITNIKQGTHAETNIEIVRMLLKEGANSRNSIPVTEVIKLNKLTLIAVFFMYSKDVNIEKLMDFYRENALELYDSRTSGKDGRRLAQELPALSERIVRCYIPYSSPGVRDQTKASFLVPFLNPPTSVQPFLSPLVSFCAKETENYPQFKVFIDRQPFEQQKQDGFLNGEYFSTEGYIELYVRNLIDNNCDTTLVHEMGHRAFEQIGWGKPEKERQIQAWDAQVKDNLQSLIDSDWAGCDPLIKKYLSPIVSGTYHQKLQFEESIVRISEILYKMGKEHPELSTEQIEQRLEKVAAFKIYKEHFIPDVQAYTQRLNS